MSENSVNYYRDGREHLTQELLKLDTLLHLKVLERKQRKQKQANGPHDREKGTEPAAGMDIFRGLYIHGDEIEELARDSGTAPGTNPDTAANPDKNTEPGTGDKKQKALGDHLEQLRKTLSVKIGNSLQAGVRLPFYHLASMFRLNLFELDTLLICLAPSLDIKYEKFFAFLQDDVTKKFPTMNLILDLLCTSGNPGERQDARSFFLDQAPLLRYGLLQFGDDDVHRSMPLLSRCLKPDNRIVDFLLGFNVPDTEISSFAGLVHPAVDFDSLVMEEELREQFQRLCGDYYAGAAGDPGKSKPGRLVFYLKGPYGAGKKTAAEAFCTRLNVPLLIVDSRGLSRCAQNRAPDFERTVKRLFRETLLQTAAIYIDGFDRISGDAGGTGPGPGRGALKEGYELEVIARAVEEFSFITFLAGEKSWQPRGRFRDQTFIPLEFPVPPYPLRKRLWERYLNGQTPGPPSAGASDIDGIAGKFQFTAGQIRDAAAGARNLAAVRGNGDNGGIAIDDLYRGCRAQSNRKLSEMALKVEPQYTWPDIVLPPDELRQLQEIRNCVKYRHLVYGDWGFDKKFSLGKGLNVLFSGPSGTGKTMAAEVIAGELGLDLYKIDLSCVVSKYIGETEKNLAGIFKEAETANAILFFDEADALFGKRSEVKDSHDRYANIETGYLLQRMEEYEGVAILATNMKKNMDEAFVRRMQFTVDFPFPNEKYRLRIWSNIFPGETPLGGGIDYEFLSKSFNISGGNIKNIALAAAFYAADDGKAVTMEHMVLACKREFQKMGKLCLKSDFGEYYGLVEEPG